MPDGDRFMRKLKGTGKGWGVAYRLASSNDLVHLPHKIVQACADNMRRIEPELIFGAVNALCGAFEREKWSRESNLLSSVEVSIKLDKDLRSIKGSADYDLIDLLKKSAQSVFNANRNDYTSISEKQIAERLGNTLIIEVMDSRFLSRVRDGIMEKQNRNVGEQMIWEQDLRGKVLPEAKRMVKNFFKGEKTKKFRVPAVRNLRKTTSDILKQKMPVLSPR